MNRARLPLPETEAETALAARPRQELVTAGAQLRRQRLSGTIRSLPQNARVATLAAGLSNRKIAIARPSSFTIKTQAPARAHLSETRHF